MYENDIKLDQYGNSVVSNGDFALTQDDSEFIYRMLITTPGSWKIHPELGVGLENFVGRLDINDVIKEMKSRIIGFFRKYMLFPNTTIYALDNNVLVVSLEFYSLGITETLNVVFSFNLENGVIKLEEENFEEEEEVEARQIVNKYLKRR